MSTVTPRISSGILLVGLVGETSHSTLTASRWRDHLRRPIQEQREAEEGCDE